MKKNLLDLAIFVVFFLLVVLVLAALRWYSNKSLIAKSTEKFGEERETVVVRVMAMQFSWHFQYAGPDGILGNHYADLISDDNLFGLDPTDPSARDDLYSSELVLPVNCNVMIDLRSSDVIHSLTNLGGAHEEDAIPGTSGRIDYQTPVIPYNGMIRCGQFCGHGHDNHHAPYRYVGETEFKNWLKGLDAVLGRMEKNPDLDN